jgi:hypothetical protein
MSKIQKRILSGFASYEAGIGVTSAPTRLRAGTRMSSSTSGNSLCPGNIGSNVLVNQNCLNVTDTDLQGRAQAQNETAIAENPSNPSQVVASFNDYRRGDGQLLRRLQYERGNSLERHHDPHELHPRHALRRRGTAVLAGRRRHVGGLGLAGERLHVVPDVHARAGRDQQP